MGAEVKILITTREDGSVQVKKLGGTFEDTGKRASKSALGIAKSWIGVTAAMAGVTLALKSTLKAGIEFEKEFANVATLVDTTTVNMNALKEGILDMSVDVTKGTTDLTQGLYQVISAGVDSADALGVLKASAIAATAGLSDTRTAVDATTTILNAYGLAASEATDVTDLMFQTVKLGKTTFTELANSIGTVIAPAASLGIKLEGLFAAMATLTKGGFDTATATTALRATLMSVLKPTTDATKTAKALNLEWSASALRAKGLVQFLNDMKEATGGNTELMALLMPETRALNAVLALTGEQAGELNQALDDMKDRLGASKAAFDEQEKTLDAQIEKFGILVKKLQTKISGIFLDDINKALRGTLDLINTVVEAREWLGAIPVGPGELEFLLIIKGINLYKDWAKATDGLTEQQRKFKEEFQQMDVEAEAKRWKKYWEEIGVNYTVTANLMEKTAVKQTKDLVLETRKAVGAAKDLAQAYGAISAQFAAPPAPPAPPAPIKIDVSARPPLVGEDYWGPTAKQLYDSWKLEIGGYDWSPPIAEMMDRPVPGYVEEVGPGEDQLVAMKAAYEQRKTIMDEFALYGLEGRALELEQVRQWHEDKNVALQEALANTALTTEEYNLLAEELAAEHAERLKFLNADVWDSFALGAEAAVEQWGTLNEQMTSAGGQMANSLSSGLGNVMFDIVSRSKSVKDAFSSMATQILHDAIRITTQMMAWQVVRKALNALGLIQIKTEAGVTAALAAETGGVAALTAAYIGLAAAKTLAGGGGGGSLLGGGGGGLSLGLFEIFAKGGILPGPFIPITPMQYGGVYDSPTLGLIGEGGQTEIVSPVPTMERVVRKVVREELGEGVGQRVLNLNAPIVSIEGTLIADSAQFEQFTMQIKETLEELEAREF